MTIRTIKCLRAAFIGAATIAAALPAYAATYSFDFLSTDGSYQANGILATADTLNSVSGYDIQGISGQVTGPGGGSITSLVTNPNQPLQTTDYSIGFIYDNVLFPTSTPKLDIGGVLFTTGSTVWNLWANNATDYELYSWGSTNGLGSNVDTHGTFSISAVPEPETYAMLLAGVAVMGAVVRSRKRHDI